MNYAHNVQVSEKSQTATKSRAAGIACLLAAEEPRQDGMLDGDSEPNGGMLPAGGYALRRARRKRTGAVEAGLEGAQKALVALETWTAADAGMLLLV